MTAFVPAVDVPDEDGIRCEVWMNPDGAVLFVTPDTTYADPAEGWRRLGYMQPVETPPFEHSDWCADNANLPRVRHINLDGGCLCNCPKCDRDGYCICPACSRPASHDHRPVTS